MEKNKKYLFVAGVVLLIIISFCLGNFASRKNNPIQNRGGQFGTEQGARNFSGDKNSLSSKGQRNFGGMVSGEVISMDSKSITLKDRSGGSRIVSLSASTTIQRTIVGSISDIKVGEQISVFGQASSDGVVKAQSIQTNLGTSTFPR